MEWQKKSTKQTKIKKNYNKNEKGITTIQNRNNEKTESKETRNKVHIQRSWKVVSYRTEVKNRIKNYGFSNGVTRLANSVLMFLMIIYFELITWSFISLINLWVISAKIYFCPSFKLLNQEVFSISYFSELLTHQSAFIFSKLTTETLEQGVKYVQS